MKELITRYHPAVLWWDINGPFTPEEVRLLTASFPQDPGLIYNNRLGGGVPGDTETPEQNIPATGYPGGRDWETCMTINDTWGFKTDDTNFKSTDTLLHNLIDIASKGGNYLLNVGPTAQGIIPAPEVERLAAVGKWMKANGEAVYGTSASPFKRLPWGRCTQKADGANTTLYLHVFDWPADGKLRVPGLTNAVRSASLLDGNRAVPAVKDADGVTADGSDDRARPDLLHGRLEDRRQAGRHRAPAHFSAPGRPGRLDAASRRGRDTRRHSV